MKRSQPIAHGLALLFVAWFLAPVLFLTPIDRAMAAGTNVATGANVMLVSTTPDAHAADASPIGSPLGMSLGDFKAMPFIDRAKYPHARVLCSGDAELKQSMAMTAMRPMPDEVAAGVIRCNVFRPDPVDLSWWAPIVPQIGGQQAKSTSYFFLPTDDGTYRLLFMQVVLPDTLLETTRTQFIGKYGTPKKRAEPGLVSESLWTESWKMEQVWLLLDSRRHSYRHDFTVTYVNAGLVDAAAARGFDETRNVLYYSVHTRFR